MIRSRLLHSALSLSACLAAFALVYAASTKLADIAEFTRTLRLHHPGRALSENVALIVAGSEMLIGVAALWLVLSRRVAPAAFLTAVVFAAFGAYAASMSQLPTPPKAGCGCGFSDGPMSIADWRSLALINSGIALSLAAIGWLSTRLLAPIAEEHSAPPTGAPA